MSTLWNHRLPSPKVSKLEVGQVDREEHGDQAPPRATPDQIERGL